MQNKSIDWRDTMGRQKIVEYYNERYKGSLSSEQCDVIDELLE